MIASLWKYADPFFFPGPQCNVERFTLFIVTKYYTVFGRNFLSEKDVIVPLVNIQFRIQSA